MTYSDKNIGIPALLSCLEMVPICLLVVWAYPVRPYIIKPRALSSESDDELQSADDSRSYQGGQFGMMAFLRVFDPRRLVGETIFAYKIIADRAATRLTQWDTAGQVEAWLGTSAFMWQIQCIDFFYQPASFGYYYRLWQNVFIRTAEHGDIRCKKSNK